MLLALTVSILAFIAGIELAGRGRPEAAPSFIFGVVGLLAAAGDIRVIRAGGIQGPRRIKRHLWRMCFAMWVAAASFFWGPPGRVPEVIYYPALLPIPVLTPVAVMLYWLWRIRRKGPPAIRRSARALRNATRIQPQGTRVMSSPKPLRLWPAVVIAIVQLLVMFGAPVVAPDAGMPIGMLGGVVGALAILVWWLFFSRARWFERVGAIVLMIVAVFATRAVAHESMAGAGQGMLIHILPTPYLALALVAWAVATRHLQDGVRRAALVAAILLACAPFAHHPNGRYQRRRRFGVPLAVDADSRATAAGPGRRRAQAAPAVDGASAVRERLRRLPRKHRRPAPASTPAAAPAAPAAAKIDTAAPAATETPAEWPGFRGPRRDSVIRGVRIETDWSKSPPVAIWRRPIGPGWSSFAVHGDLLYTQEQRGDDEVVSCYRVSTGEPVWRHRDAVRFYESNGGAGPRATPTLSHGRVYTLGATAVLNALDAGNGNVVWSRNAASDTGRKIPEWGIASSPLVVDDIVIVAVSGTLAAYDLATGKPRWVGPQHGGSYSSPQLVTIDGVAQVLLLSAPGAVSVSPADGKLLWEHTWEGGAIVQPALTADGGVLINAMSMMGGIGHAPPCGRARSGRMDRRRALDVEWAEAVLQRFRRSQGPCLRLRRQHPRVHRPRGRQAQVEGRTLRQRPARPVGRPGLGVDWWWGGVG